MYKSSRVAQWVKDPALALQWLRSLPRRRFGSLAWELLHATGAAKKKKKIETKKKNKKTMYTP